MEYRFQLADDIVGDEGYVGSNVFLLCYSIDSRESFENIKNKWYPSLKKSKYSKVPRMLVATKTDLLKDEDEDDEHEILGPSQHQKKEVHVVETSEGIKLRKEIGAIGFIECSAKKFENVNEVFYYIAEYLETGKMMVVVDTGNQKKSASAASKKKKKKKKKTKKKKKSKGIFDSISRQGNAEDDVAVFTNE